MAEDPKKPISQPSNEVIREMAELTDTVLLSFSLGKDSIACWVAMRRHFKRIIPFYLYVVPGLEFVSNSLRYYEQHFGERIIEMPHPSLYRMLRNCVFQPPPNWPIIDAAGLPSFSYRDLEDTLRDELHLGPTAYVATGVRATDSIQRRNAIRAKGAIYHDKKKFLPVWDWKKDRVISEITSAGLKLPVDYSIYARSLDGINYQYLEPMKRRFPRDYARVLEFFPLAELELRRMEYAQRS